MKMLKTVLLAAAALALATPALAQPIPPPADVKPAKPVFAADFMNIFRRFSPDIRDKMVEFYNQVLGLQALTPIQLSKTQQMLLFKVGKGQIKLASGLNAGRDYHPGGALNDTTGIRLITLYFPDEAALKASFKAHGYPEPEFKDIGGGRKAAIVHDPGGFRVELIVWPNAPDDTYGRINVGINASNLERSRAFYRDFVGLDELPPEHDSFLGVTKYPFRHGTTTVDLWSVGHDLPKDTGSAGIQYITSNVEAINALAQERHVAVETPLGGVRGFNVVTVWLNDPDGVTDYFYELGPGGRRGPPPGGAPPPPPAAAPAQ
jgi:catechol 2,3-dioxygenase-like lactoylglutathione lyase family enzyme